MRALKRNQRQIWFANFDRAEPIRSTDEWGNVWETGEYDVLFHESEPLLANVSPARGESTTRQFGESEDYDKVIVLAGKSPVSETSVLWIDNIINGKIPEVDDAKVPYDYVVKKVAESIHSTTVAVKKVNISFSKVAVLSPTDFKLYDENGEEIFDGDNRELYAIASKLFDIEGNPLHDKDGNILMVGR